MSEATEIFSNLLRSRQTVLPKRLQAPGPNEEQLAQILGTASHAPDHGQLLPWRFVVIPMESRAVLGSAFADALKERDPTATAVQMEQAHEKALRAPLLILLIVDQKCGDPEIDLFERLVSAGCAVQNMLLMSTAQGFGSALTSGKALKSNCLRRLFQLHSDEHAICFLSIGTGENVKPPRRRPKTEQYVSYLASS
jgi:nitroreductase